MADYHVIKAAKYSNQYWTGFDDEGNPLFGTTDFADAIQFLDLTNAEAAAVNMLPGETLTAVTETGA